MNKENIQYACACISLMVGFGLCVAGFIYDPTGEIHNSVLWLMGQCFIYSGGVFGIKSYIDYKLPKT